jgi:hypothetical protein
MPVVQIVLDKKLLHAADLAARRYARHSPTDAEAQGWESEAAWP